MHNDHIIYTSLGFTTSRTHNGNKVLDPATIELLLDWCEVHRPECCWPLNTALACSRTYWALRMGRIDGNRDEMRAHARFVRSLSADAVVAFKCWSLSN